MAEAPTSYPELIRVLIALPRLMLETRRRCGFTTAAAARQLGMVHSVYKDYELGKVQPTLPRVIRILRWLYTAAPAPAPAPASAPAAGSDGAP